MHQIRTVLKHECPPPPVNKGRGSRYWSAAEILSSTWYVVESCVEAETKNQVNRWMTTSIKEAIQIQRTQGLCYWSHIFVCLRAPLSIKNATIFEVVNEAHQVGSTNSYVLQLTNGMSFITGDDDESVNEWPDPKMLRMVYPQQSR